MTHHPDSFTHPLSRRDMLARTGLGFGTWALLHLLARDQQRAGAAAPPAVQRRAKNVIFLFMQGGPSHIDTFDPKPLLNKLHGKPLPASVTKGLQLQFTKMDAALLGSPQKFSKCGRSGLEIADTYPHLQSLCRSPGGGAAFVLSRFVQPRARPVHAEHGLLAHGPSVPGFVGELRPGQRQREPAGLRGHGHHGRRQGWPAGL